MKPEDVPAHLVTEFRRAGVMATLDVANGADPIRAFLAHFLPEVQRGAGNQVVNAIEFMDREGFTSDYVRGVDAALKVARREVR